MGLGHGDDRGQRDVLGRRRSVGRLCRNHLACYYGLGGLPFAAHREEKREDHEDAGSTGDGSVIRKYKVLSMPTTVFINPDGTIFETWPGILNLRTLERLTNVILKQVEKVPSEQGPS